MAKAEIFLPSMGEGIIEATITKWLVKEGDQVEEDDPIVEVATDKVDTEIPSPGSGTVSGIAFGEGDTPKVGDIIAYLEVEGEEELPEELKKTVDNEFRLIREASTSESAKKEENKSKSAEMMSRTPNGKYLSPLVRKIAKEEGIALDMLDTISGTGMDGRVTKDDLLSFIDQQKEQSRETESEKVQAASPAPKAPAGIVADNGDEIIEMDRVRKLIAEHMVVSKRTSPHVTTFIDVDVTDIINWRNRVKDSFLKKEGIKLTLTPIFFEATARAIRQYPMVNISVDGTKIIKKKNINIGMATALPDGNLIVPVIKRSDELSILGLAREVNDLASRARASKLKPDEISGGTFTITNYGTVGNLMGTPIINQPQAAILGIGAVKKMPAVIETPSGDSIGIRHIAYLSLSYDHRVIDGALAGMFVKSIKDNLEKFLNNKFLADIEF